MRGWLEAWTRDLILAARSLRRAPGFAAVTIATLAIAIGANTAIFSVVNSVLLDPLDFPAADRLVSIRASAPGSDLPEEFGPAPEFYIQYRDNAEMLEDIGMYRSAQTTVRADDRFDRLFITQATGDLFTTLGAQVQAGRLPTSEDPPGQVMVLSDWLWRSWLGADPEVVGRSYEVSGQMLTVIGVMQPEFRFPDARISLWMYQRLGDENQLRPGNFGFNFVGRVRPGVAPEDLEPQLRTLASRLPELYGGPPQYARIIEQHRPIVRTLQDELVGNVAGPLWLLMGTVGIVLLIACANVANLFSVRAEGRRGDLDVRQALGAGRAGLVRAQMAEPIILAGLGGIGGVILAWIALPILVRVAPESIPNLDLTSLDSTALIFTVGVTLLTAAAFGLAPALLFSSSRSVGGMRRAGGVGAGRTLGRDALVLVQTGAALVLLVGAGLLMRSFLTLSNVDPGYDTEDIFTFQVAPSRDELTDGPSYAQFHQDFAERVAALPGVESVGFANTIPLDEGAGTTRLHTEATLLSGEDPPPINFTWVGGQYFETMGIALESGRTLDRSDHVVGPPNIVISSAAAERFWPGEQPLGQLLRLSSDTTAWATVVGIVEDIFLRDFRQAAPDPMVYLPLVGPQPRTWAVGSPAYVLKSARADVIAPEVRALMNEYVPESPMYRVFTMEALADRTMARLSFTMLMVAIAAVLALILGAVGLYGVLSYVVSNRAPEIAVRMALGAEAQRVQRMVVLQGARITGAGVLVGLVAALMLTRALDSMLFGVGSLDVPTFVAMSAVMIAVALVASYLPARRASLMDPMQALRTE